MRIMRKRKQQGFTLTEVVIVIVIISALATIAMPVLLNVIPNMQLRAGGQEVFRAIQTAKAEANKRNRKVILDFPLEDCSVNAVGYTPYPYKTCEFVKDANISDTDPCAKAGEGKYHATSLMPPHAAVCSDSRVPQQGMARIVFLPTGLLDVKNKERGPFYLHLSHINKKRHMYVQVERSGAVRVLAEHQKPTN